MDNTWKDILAPHGIAEVNLWGVNGLAAVGAGGTVVNPTPLVNPALGYGRNIPFRIPQNHYLAISEIRMGDILTAADPGTELRFYADKINGATTLIMHIIFSRQNFWAMSTPLILPADYIFGISIINRHAAATQINWNVSGYLVRVGK